MKINTKFFSIFLSVSLIIGSMPIQAGAVDDPTNSRPTAEDLLGSDYMKPEDFDRTAVSTMADEIVSSLDSVTDIGRLPSYEEFAEDTNYEPSILTLTEFRNRYGTGGSFSEPQHYGKIYINSSEELDLLSALVGFRADNEATAEQRFYSCADYVLAHDLIYTSSRFLPIGTEQYPFDGSFCGEGFEISGLTISEDSADIYQGVSVFGLFGCIGSSGHISELGLTNVTIYLPYSVGADVGVIAGKNYGTITDCYVNGKETTSVTVSNATVGGIAAENYGTISGTYADFRTDVSITSGTYSDPQPITAVNSGQITDSYYVLSDNQNGFFGTGLSETDFTEIPGTKFRNGEIVFEDNAYEISVYPTICIIESDTNGNYHITKPSELMYFIKHGTGENLILDNTIDMRVNPIERDYGGSFSLDGTLTDETDICSYIDLGTGKCCGILNLSIRNTVLSRGNVTLNNVYFIGGEYHSELILLQLPTNEYRIRYICSAATVPSIPFLTVTFWMKRGYQPISAPVQALTDMSLWRQAHTTLCLIPTVLRRRIILAAWAAGMLFSEEPSIQRLITRLTESDKALPIAIISARSTLRRTPPIQLSAKFRVWERISGTVSWTAQSTS